MQNIDPIAQQQVCQNYAKNSQYKWGYVSQYGLRYLVSVHEVAFEFQLRYFYPDWSFGAPTAETGRHVSVFTTYLSLHVRTLNRWTECNEILCWGILLIFVDTFQVLLKSDSSIEL